MKRALVLLIVAHLLGACTIVIKEGGPVPPSRPKEFSK